MKLMQIKCYIPRNASVYIRLKKMLSYIIRRILFMYEMLCNGFCALRSFYCHPLLQLSSDKHIRLETVYIYIYPSFVSRFGRHIVCIQPQIYFIKSF